MGTYAKYFISCTSNDKELNEKICYWINTRKDSGFSLTDKIEDFCWNKWSESLKWYVNFMKPLSEEFKDVIFIIKTSGGYSYTEFYLNGECLSEEVIFPKKYPTIKQFSEALIRNKKELKEKAEKLAKQRKEQEEMADRERLEFLRKETAALEEKLKV